MTDVLRRNIHRGTVAVVTGGGTGIGRAVALELARCGADVVICGRRPEPLEKTAAEIEALGARALAVPADIRDEEQVAGLVESTLERFGRIDTLVNNAGGQLHRTGRADHRKGLARSAPPRRRRGMGGNPRSGGHGDDPATLGRDVSSWRSHRGVAWPRWCTPPPLALRWRIWPQGSPWNGAGSGSGPCASRPGRSRPRPCCGATRRGPCPLAGRGAASPVRHPRRSLRADRLPCLAGGRLCHRHHHRRRRRR